MCKRLLWITALAGVAGAQTQGVVGIWQGTLNVGAWKMRLALHVVKNENGGLTSTLDSVWAILLAVFVPAPADSLYFRVSFPTM